MLFPMCTSQGLDGLSSRRRLRRGETVDCCAHFIHPPGNSHSFKQTSVSRTKNLSRSHTIHQVLTHSSREDLQLTQCNSTAVEMVTSGASDHPINLSPEPEQVTEKADESLQASVGGGKEKDGEEKGKEEEEKGKEETGKEKEEKGKEKKRDESEEKEEKGDQNLHWVSTDMDSIVL